MSFIVVLIVALIFIYYNVKKLFEFLILEFLLYPRLPPNSHIQCTMLSAALYSSQCLVLHYIVIESGLYVSWLAIVIDNSSKQNK